MDQTPGCCPSPVNLSSVNQSEIGPQVDAGSQSRTHPVFILYYAHICYTAQSASSSTQKAINSLPSPNLCLFVFLERLPPTPPTHTRSLTKPVLVSEHYCRSGECRQSLARQSTLLIQRHCPPLAPLAYPSAFPPLSQKSTLSLHWL